MDYQSNSKKSKEPKEPEIPDKQIQKVVEGEVIQKPKSIGRRFKDIFFGGDTKTAITYVSADVLLPALRTLLVDMVTKGAERLVFGESTYRRRPTSYSSRIQYNNPMVRPTGQMMVGRPNPGIPDQPSWRKNRREFQDIVLASRSEAETVVERLIDIIEKYDVASMADLYDLLGLPSSHIDNKWGWTYLNDVEIRQVREGYLIALPSIQEI